MIWIKSRLFLIVLGKNFKEKAAGNPNMTLVPNYC